MIKKGDQSIIIKCQQLIDTCENTKKYLFSNIN